MKPSVTCVMLTADRPELTRRAVAEWKKQTYPNAYLFVFDTGKTFAMLDDIADRRIVIARSTTCEDLNVGDLRNAVNEGLRTDLFAHFDSDDWSAPDRLEKQVAALELMERQATGYRSMAYWSTVPGTEGAWLYSHPSPDFVLGGSLLYWRSAWRDKPFPSRQVGEDTVWIRGILTTSGEGVVDGRPRMIARHHGRNTSHGIVPGLTTGDVDNAGRFRRAPELDAACRLLLSEE